MMVFSIPGSILLDFFLGNRKKFRSVFWSKSIHKTACLPDKSKKKKNFLNFTNFQLQIHPQSKLDQELFLNWEPC